MVRTARRSGVSRDRGAAAVELALVVPILMGIIFGIVQFAMLFSQSSALANAARSGARLGSVNLVTKADCRSVLEATREQALSLGMRSEEVAVSVRSGDSGADLDDVAGQAPVCSVPGGSSSVLGAAAAKPCTSSSTASQKLVVRVEYDAVISLPFVPEITVPRSATGVYRCEYQ